MKNNKDCKTCEHFRLEEIEIYDGKKFAAFNCSKLKPCLGSGCKSWKGGKSKMIVVYAEISGVKDRNLCKPKLFRNKCEYQIKNKTDMCVDCPNNLDIKTRKLVRSFKNLKEIIEKQYEAYLPDSEIYDIHVYDFQEVDGIFYEEDIEAWNNM